MCRELLLSSKSPCLSIERMQLSVYYALRLLFLYFLHHENDLQDGFSVFKRLFLLMLDCVWWDEPCIAELFDFVAYSVTSVRFRALDDV